MKENYRDTFGGDGLAEHNYERELELGNLKADVRVLIRDIAEGGKRLTKLENKCEDFANVSTAISVMSVSLEHIVEHNHKQDILAKNQNGTLSKINDNLSKLNQGQARLDEKVESLEERVNYNEDVNMVDLRSIDRKSVV